MKILSLNAGYFLGFDGTAVDYFRSPLKTVLGDNATTADRIDRFCDLVQKEKPEAILLQEIDRGSIRGASPPAPEALEKGLPDYYSGSFSTKYGGIIGRLPFARNMSNSVLAREGVIKDHFLKNGTKNLVQELRVDDLSIFSVHLARFGKKVRRKQLEEISAITQEREKFVVAGDFNFINTEEQETAENLIGRKTTPGKTFPAKNPSKTLDMAFSSRNLELTTEALETDISDHRPVVIRLESR